MQVFISTYVNVSANYVLKALKKGKHVFCEKPPAMNSQELEEILDFQNGSKLILKYGFKPQVALFSIRSKKVS